MKSSSEIIGLPVLDITSGEAVSKVVSLIIDPDTGKVAYLLLERPNSYAEMHLLDYKHVLGIGDYAVTTEKKDHIQYVTHTEEALKLLQKDVKVLGAKVLSHKGKMLGTVREITLDENTGEIASCEVIPAGDGQEPFQIPRSSMLTFGKSHLIVREPKGENWPFPSPDAIESPGFRAPSNLASHDAEAAQVTPTGAPDENNQNQEQDLMELLKEQQIKFLLGRRCTKTIKDQSGNIIVEEGQVIDETVIKKAQETDTYIELSMFAE